MTETLQSGLADLEEGRVSDYVPRKPCTARIWVDGWERTCSGGDDHTGKHRCVLDLPGYGNLTIVWDQ